MGKKRGAAAAAPVFPFPAADDEPRHFSDYGFDDDCFSYATAKRPAAAMRHDQHQPPPMESARFKLQKPISKKHHHNKKQQQQQQQRRRWWSSALLFFKRGSSSDATASVDPSSYRTNELCPAGPLYLAVEDEGDDGAPAACACWAPAMRSGHLAASELGASASVLPYVSLRDSAVGGRGAPPPPAMPIYLVT